MVRGLYIGLLILMSSSLFGQRVVVYGVNGVNTERNEIFCYYQNDTLVFASDSFEDLVADLERSDVRHFIPYSASMDENLTKYRVHGSMDLCEGDGDVGPVSKISNGDYYFSTSNDLGSGNKGRLNIYSQQKDAQGNVMIMPFEHNLQGFHTVHPNLSRSEDKLVFSSDRPGTKGGMDIWFCIKESDGSWSEPMHLDTEMNSPSNELFPFEMNGDIYFSSDRDGGQGGYDLYKATKSSQWKNVVRLESPLNSDKDDIQIAFMDDFSGYLTSSREGAIGGDDIFYFEIENPDEIKGSLSAILVCKGTPIHNAKIKISNMKNELLWEDSTRTDGKIDLEGFALNRKYKLKVEGVAPEVLKETLMYILDESGRKIRVYRFNEEGYFLFEMLPFDDMGDMALLNNDDESVLTIGLQGQIYIEEPGDVGAGEAVYALDKDGQLLALSYTESDGMFSMDDIDPKPIYKIKTDDKFTVAHVLIFDKGQQHNIPIRNGVAEYKRMDFGEGIELLDEDKNTIWIDAEDVFIVNNIYYEFNSADLNEDARNELNKLVRVMTNNPSIHIDLSSHTDCRGNSDYNIKLSEKRAKIAAQYLSKEGVNRKRINYTGYGETRLLNNCARDEDCSEEEHAHNRRTEIVIFIDDFTIQSREE